LDQEVDAEDVKQPAKAPAKGSDLLAKSQAERWILDVDGRPKDGGGLLDALRREHPEKDPNAATSSDDPTSV